MYFYKLLTVWIIGLIPKIGGVQLQKILQLK